MSPLIIQEAIFKAVDVIVEKRLKQLNFNYCIQGIISSEPCFENNGELYFWVEYQDMKIKAYPISSTHQKDSLMVFDGDTTIDLENKPLYKEGDLVYTLVINGDLNKKRLILCKA